MTSHHSIEKLGFHGPAVMGCYGGAAAAARVYGLNAEQTTHALGIAGSLSSGLLAFSKSKNGAMVKRLHMGRTSESAILAARLAATGYTGPETVLEGKFGFLEAYCRDARPELLTKGLNSEWITLGVSLKRYACHVFAHIPVESVRTLMAEHRIAPADIAKVVIEGGEKLLTHHNILDPEDILKAQYSVPFCVALAIHRDPDDPRSFEPGALADPAIQAASRNVELRVRSQDGLTPWSARTTIKLRYGRELSLDRNSYQGMPQEPLTADELRRKFTLLTAEAADERAIARTFERLQNLEREAKFSAAIS
jgi:2-methylcitrate dehydratase PrpD